MAVGAAHASRQARMDAQSAKTKRRAGRELTDETGRRVVIPARVNRVVALAPNLAEIMYALGEGQKLVGISEYSTVPEATPKVANIGMPVNPSLEAIAGLRPDVVLAAAVNRWATVEALTHLGIPVYGTDPKSVEGMLRAITDIGSVIGADAQAQQLVAKLRAQMDALRARLAQVPPKRVFFVVWEQPLISTGENTFIADALRWAGGESVVRAEQDWPNVSLEEVVKLNPDYLVFAEKLSSESQTEIQAAILRKAQDLRARAGWQNLPVVKEGRVAVISDEINSPAPGLIAAIEQLARELHPQVFQPNAAPANQDSYFQVAWRAESQCTAGASACAH